jgi:hypothetical protein
MPPKIRGMTIISNSPQSAQKRFTLMLAGEDAHDSEEGQVIGDRPLKGLPHERFLLGDHVPLAPVLLLGQTSQVVNPAEVIACLQPVHLHASRDHLILMGQNQINLTEAESTELLQAALPFIEEDFQSSILYQGSRYWFISAGPFASLASYSVDQAHGRNIEWWMPRDTDEAGIAKRWRKLQNEIQMLWHIGSVNQEREQVGMPSINSVWISGIGKLHDVKAPGILQQAHSLCGSHPILAGLAKLLKLSYETEFHIRMAPGSFAWLDQPERIWPELRKALLEKELDEIHLIDFPKGKVRKRVLTTKDLYKKSWAFWKKSVPLTWKEIIL